MNRRLELLERFVLLRARYQRREVTLEAVYAAADEYIDSLKEYRRETGRKVPLPTRAALMRLW